MVRHQAPRPHLDPGGASMFGQQVALQRVIGVLEEGTRPAVAALGHVVRMTGNDDTGEAGHAASCRRRDAESIKCTVTVIQLRFLLDPTADSRPCRQTDNNAHFHIRAAT